MRTLLAMTLLAASACAQLSPEQKQLNIDSFEKVWTTIRDKHWEKNPGGLDWNAIHDEFRPRIEAAPSTDAARAIMRDMLARLHQTHFAIFPSVVYEDVGVEIQGDGAPGIDLRVLGNQAVVTMVDPGSPAEKAGVKPGWTIVSSRGKDLAPIINTLQADPSIKELTLVRALLARLTGPIGGKLERHVSRRREPEARARATAGRAARPDFPLRKSSRHACLVRIDEDRQYGLRPLQHVPGHAPRHGQLLRRRGELQTMRWPDHRPARQSGRHRRHGHGYGRVRRGQTRREARHHVHARHHAEVRDQSAS